MDGFCKSLHPFRTNVHSTPPGVKSAQPEPGYPPAIKKHRYGFAAMRKTHCIFRRSGDTFGGEKSRAEEQKRRHQGHAEAGRKVAPGRRPGRGGGTTPAGPGSRSTPPFAGPAGTRPKRAREAAEPRDPGRGTRGKPGQGGGKTARTKRRKADGLLPARQGGDDPPNWTKSRTFVIRFTPAV